MDPGFRTPLLDTFRRGEVAGEVRLMAARGTLAPRAHEQLALLLLLLDDADFEISQTAAVTLDLIPRAPLERFLARSDVSPEIVAFFRARGIEPVPGDGPESDEPLFEADTELAETADTGTEPSRRPLSLLSVMERLKLAMRGTREQRSLLIRDSNKLVAVAVMSSPKLSESEVETYARMANVSEDVLRIIGTTRAWLKNYSIVSALARNPKTPPAISLGLIKHLTERDVKFIAIDRNVPEPLRLAARKVMVKEQSRRR